MGRCGYRAVGVNMVNPGATPANYQVLGVVGAIRVLEAAAALAPLATVNVTVVHLYDELVVEASGQAPARALLEAEAVGVGA